MAARFHNTLAAAIVESAGGSRAGDGLGRVCLSGGTFQNMRLLGSAVAGLRGSGFEVFLHARSAAQRRRHRARTGGHRRRIHPVVSNRFSGFVLVSE